MNTHTFEKGDISMTTAIVVGVLFALLAISTGGFSVQADVATTTVSVGNAQPSIDNITFNSGSDITLTENTFVDVVATVTVSDSNGCSDINGVTSTAYRSGVGVGSGTGDEDVNSRYYQQTSECTQAAGTCGDPDTSADYTCTFRIWYPADPTDATSTFAAQIWEVEATAGDGTATVTATNSAETVEILSLLALDVSASIAYGPVAAGTDTGSDNQRATSTNTGNIAQDNEISANNDMCSDYPTCSANEVAADQQKYATSSVTYASLDFTLSSTTPATRELDLAQPTSTSTPVEDTTFWGINIPGGTPNDSYTGQNLFTAVLD